MRGYELGVLPSLLRRFALRYWIRHVAKLGLLIAIVALGIGSFLAIGLANRSATESFDAFAEIVAGRSQAVVTSAAGPLRIEDLRRLRRALQDTEATLFPHLIASGHIIAEDAKSSAAFTLVGADLLAASNYLLREKAVGTFWDSTGGSEHPVRATAPQAYGFYSQRSTALEFGWVKDQPVAFIINGTIANLRWLGPLPEIPESQDTASRALVLDWKRLQQLANRPGEIDRVDIIAPAELGATGIADLINGIEEANPGYWIVDAGQERQRIGSTMTQAFRMNLRALSILSLCVAVCLVFQAMDSALARRQSEISTLLSLGVSPRATRLLWLTDAAFIGLCGGLAGLALGLVMARFSSALVTQTVSMLYHRTDGAALSISVGEGLLAVSLSVVACLAAGWWPARQAARSPLAETMRLGAQRSTYSRRRYVAAIIVLATVGIAAYFAPPMSAANGHGIPVGGYVLALALIGVAACLSCLLLDTLGALTSTVAAWSASAQLALSQFRMPVTRHRLALAGVTISIGMTAAMVFLIGSFESTVRAWIGTTLQADLFIRSRAASSMRDDSKLDTSLLEFLRNDARVADIGTVASDTLRYQGLSTQLVGYDSAYLDRVRHFTWLKEPPSVLALADGATAVVSESFANRFRKTVGDTVTLEARGGPDTFSIIGVYADYGNEGGTLGIDQTRYREITGDGMLRAIAVHAREPGDIEPLRDAIESAYPALAVMTNRWLREETLRIFKRVFSITYALEVIGLVISVAGLGAMLASLLIERRAEISALQRLGLSPAQIARATLWEGLALSGLGAATGLALGGLLGLVLIFIINKQSFGWTLSVSIPWIELAGLAMLTLAGAAIVSYLIGRWASRLPILREE